MKGDSFLILTQKEKRVKTRGKDRRLESYSITTNLVVSHYNNTDICDKCRLGTSFDRNEKDERTSISNKNETIKPIKRHINSD